MKIAPEYKALIAGFLFGIGVSFLLYLIFGFDFIFLLLWTVVTLGSSVSAYSFVKYAESKKLTQIEEKFPSFLRDLAESIRAGLTIPEAVILVSKTNYGPLSEDVKKLSNALTWDTPFPEAISLFQKRLKKSEFIKRGVSILLQAFFAGGKTAEAIESIAESTVLLQEIKKDRESILKEQLIVLYVIQILFGAILVAIYKILIPLLTLSPGAGFFLQLAQAPPIEYYKTLLFLAIVIQSICNGVVAGVAREGSVISGLKHAGVMVAIGLVLFVIFIMPVEFKVTADLSERIATLGQTLTLSGEVIFESKTMPNVNINVTLPEATKLITTNVMGAYTFDFKAPSKVGLYEIEIKTTYQRYHAKKRVQFVVR